MGPRVKDTTHSNASSPTVLSWARIAQPERVSLVHTHRQHNNMEPDKIYYFSRIWKTGRSPGSVIFDISPCPGVLDDTIATLMKTFPNNNGIIPHKEGVRVLAEINLNSEEERILAIDKGIDFTPEINIRATRALHKKAKIKKLRLTDLPLLPEQVLTQGLRTTFQPYGEILDIGINRNHTTKAYMGNGFAILDIQEKEGQPLENLNHPIPWCGNEDDLIYAHFEGMPLFCSRCHQPDHCYEDCPRLHRNQQQKKCFHCGGFDHYNTICPKERNATLWSPGTNKTSWRKTGHSTTTPSKELKKSIHAPQNTQKKKQPSNCFGPLTETTEDQDSSLDDTSTLTRRGIIEESLDLVIMDFADFKIDLPMIPADEQELAINKPPTSDWVDSLELSDNAKDIITDPDFPEDLKPVLFTRLLKQRTICLQEYEDSLMSSININSTKSDISAYSSSPGESSNQL
ncbi:hypothetical protein INT45_003111 [Circinella minor]|uniref:CCHC-type domain-containing protein n=1 Tax=Circinella minor TaxID=1195481 RepID=A0A8H7RLR8_9FUNG|nr:hypothetical protein INT45_003111 [Circinella minor]